MIMISIEDLWFSDMIYIETITQFVKYYLKVYQLGMVILGAIIVCFTLLISICVIRTIVLNPIQELTRVIQTGDQKIIDKF